MVRMRLQQMLMQTTASSPTRRQFIRDVSLLYRNTRRLVLSNANPYYFKGQAAEGPGGPPAGLDMVWPLGIIQRALTSTDDREIRFCLDSLQRTHAGTGFMHEAFHKDDPKKFTRPWFVWAKTSFGELILKVHKERPYLLN
jgi:uncharacterized protein